MELFPPQKDVISRNLLEKPAHCLLNMATSSGKTFLSEIAIDTTLKQGFKALYVTPLRALAAQQYEKYKEKFTGYKVGIFTGETVHSGKINYSSTQLYIMTPERLDACLRNWRSHWNWIPDVNLVVIDEFHILGQGQRGARLEGTITRLIRLNPFIKILGLSATMPNAEDLAGWLSGVFYASQWRRVPLEKKIVRFSSANDKPQLMLEEVSRCLQAGGQSLIFCNSRSRVQHVVEYLKDHHVPAAYHHAGLLPDERSETEEAFRKKQIPVLVATSTLEMGLNLPARQVIIYDSFSYSQSGFSSLPVWSFIQRAGRAGRPGLDDNGEIVLMLPKWDGNAARYLNEECEPVTSQLSDPRALSEQILIDVYAGYSRTRRELADGFLPLTFYQYEHPEASIQKVINQLIFSDLLIDKQEEETRSDQEPHLKVGLLGRMAVKLMFTPESIRMFRDAGENLERLYVFDILLLAAMSEDCSPVLPANYEEIDQLCDTVQPLPSSLLELTVMQLKSQMPDTPTTSRLLAAIKMAGICYSITQGTGISDIADDYDLYEADIRMLQENMVRLLTGMSALYHAIDRSKYDEERLKERQKDMMRPAQMSVMVANMLQYGISSDLVSLTQIHGIGGKLARRLSDNGFRTILSIANADPIVLSAIDGIGKKLASSVVKDAKQMIKDNEVWVYEEDPYDDLVAIRDVKTTIDPYRLRRSLDLVVRAHEAGKYCISGGRDDHIVIIRKGQFTCDCLDYMNHNGEMDCKHILCVKRVRGDKGIARMVKQIKEDKEHSVRESLPTLWFSYSTEKRS